MVRDWNAKAGNSKQENVIGLCGLVFPHSMTYYFLLIQQFLHCNNEEVRPQGNGLPGHFLGKKSFSMANINLDYITFYCIVNTNFPILKIRMH